MKLVIATPFYPPQTSVLSLYASELETAFKELGYEVRVVKLTGSIPLLRHLWFALRLFFALQGARFVLALDVWSVGQPALLAARLRGVPFVVRVGGDFLWEAYIERTGEELRLSDFYEQHGTLSPRERRIFSMLSHMMRHSAHVFFNSRFQKELWERVYAIDTVRSSLLENVYPQRVETGAPQGKVFVSPNRRSRYKNDARLREVFERVHSRHPDAQLDTTIVSYVQQMERFARAYALIVPSISEVNSNMAIEMVVRGRPFIMSEDSGSKDRLSACGLFVDTRSPEALERAIEDMLRADVYERLASNCRAFSFTRTWREIASDILAATHR